MNEQSEVSRAFEIAAELMDETQSLNDGTLKVAHNGMCSALWSACGRIYPELSAQNILMTRVESWLIVYYRNDARKAGPSSLYWGLNYANYDDDYVSSESTDMEAKGGRVLTLLFLSQITYSQNEHVHIDMNAKV